MASFDKRLSETGALRCYGRAFDPYDRPFTKGEDPNPMSSMFDQKPQTAVKEIVNANILAVEAGTNGAHGGDAGHGGRTYIGLRDLASTAWEVRVTSGAGSQLISGPEAIEIVLGGDSELQTLVEALEFALAQLRA